MRPQSDPPQVIAEGEKPPARVDAVLRPGDIVLVHGLKETRRNGLRRLGDDGSLELLGEAS